MRCRIWGGEGEGLGSFPEGARGGLQGVQGGRLGVLGVAVEGGCQPASPGGLACQLLESALAHRLQGLGSGRG